MPSSGLLYAVTYIYIFFRKSTGFTVLKHAELVKDAIFSLLLSRE